MADNQNRFKEIYLVFFKKKSGVQCINYDESVEEALCFGWIDSIVRAIDDQKYCQKFTPRNPKSNWSDLNKKRVQKLLADGKIETPGMRLIQPIIDDGTLYISSEKTIPDLTPEFIENALEANPEAFYNFYKLAISHRKQYIMYISSAKREETRLKRLNEAINLLIDNKKIGMK
ncbi:MAG: YdeI/OmpD-associated family protein [Candidatus Kapabacteria bacterium]|nr:YdeI/OmpD-associated family protein [Candidatus Kapabacteria bacterium]